MNFGELLEVVHKRTCDGVQCPVGLALASEIHVRNAIGIFDFAVASEPVQHECESLVAFHIAGTFEVFIEHCADQILRRGDEARDGHLVGDIPADQAVVIGEVDCYFHKERCARR